MTRRGLLSTLAKLAGGAAALSGLGFARTGDTGFAQDATLEIGGAATPVTAGRGGVPAGLDPQMQEVLWTLPDLNKTPIETQTPVQRPPAPAPDRGGRATAGGAR